MTIFRRSADIGMMDRVFRLLVMISVLVMAPGALQARTFKIATVSPDGLAWMKEFRAGIKEVEARTEGRVKFKLYPGGVQGDDYTVLRKMRIGQLQGGAVAATALTRFYPDLQIYSLPLTFRSPAEVDYVRQRMDQRIIDGLSANGIVSFGLTETGFAYLLSKQPVNTLADLQQMKIWMPDGDPIAAEMSKAFSVNPIPLLMTDVLAGLQTGLVEAVTVPPVVALALQWHNHVSYMVDVPLLYTYSMMMLDKKAFDGVSPDDQRVVHEVLGAVFSKVDRTTRIDNRSAFQALVNQGVKLTEPTAAELATWRQHADVSIRGLIDNNTISPETLELLQRHLAESRTVGAGGVDSTLAGE
ncbi:MAG: TRAP transporter substrate-binding protein DctP [Pseudomonadota bacterium]